MLVVINFFFINLFLIVELCSFDGSFSIEFSVVVKLL